MLLRPRARSCLLLQALYTCNHRNLHKPGGEETTMLIEALQLLPLPFHQKSDFASAAAATL
jgi:hypothetical protein